MRGLKNAVEDVRINKVDVRRPDLRVPFPENMAEALEGESILRFQRRGKYIWAHLSNGMVLVIHLGMSGRVSIARQDMVPGKHDHLVVDFEDGQRVLYNDARRFGMVFLLGPEALAAHPAFAQMGPEPLDPPVTGTILAARLKGRKTPMKAALLDQCVIAGLGNIYVCESLFQAGIDPMKPAEAINQQEAGRLASAIVDVLQRAIDAGGSTLRDYQHADGSLGYFQHQFSVYGRAGAPCPRCDCEVNRTGGIEKIVQSGRSTFYCPRKQS